MNPMFLSKKEMDAIKRRTEEVSGILPPSYSDRRALLQHIKALEGVIEKVGAMFEAERRADELLAKAVAHADDAKACGYDSDPTGSLHVAESIKKQEAASEAWMIAREAAMSAYNQFKKEAE